MNSPTPVEVLVIADSLRLFIAAGPQEPGATTAKSDLRPLVTGGGLPLKSEGILAYVYVFVGPGPGSSSCQSVSPGEMLW